MNRPQLSCFCPHLFWPFLISKPRRSYCSAFPASEEVFADKKASFLSPVAQNGYVPIPSFCSYRPQTPVYRLQAGERLASVAIRRLRRLHQHELGPAPAVIYVAGCYGVFALEEVLRLLGTAPRESLLPALRTTSSSDAPT